MSVVVGEVAVMYCDCSFMKFVIDGTPARGSAKLGARRVLLDVLFL